MIDEVYIDEAIKLNLVSTLSIVSSIVDKKLSKNLLDQICLINYLK